MARIVKRLAFIISALLVLSRMGSASGEGTSGASFLKIDNCARTAAMAGAVCGVCDDIATAGYNAAALSMIRSPELLVGHNEWFSGIKNEYVGYAHPLNDRFVIGGWANYFQVGNLTERDTAGDATGGTFGVSGAAATLGAGIRLDRRWSIGAAVKAINETLADKSDIAYAGDAGILYALPRVRCGLAIQNAGTGIKVNEESFSLPTTCRVGIGVWANDHLIVSADAIKGIESTIDYRLGGEMRIAQLLSLRAGYRFAPAVNTGSGISAGIGINVGIFSFDYAFLSYGDLGDTHRVSFKIAFPYIQHARRRALTYKDLKPVRKTLNVEDKSILTKKKPVSAKDSSIKSKQTVPEASKPVKKYNRRLVGHSAPKVIQPSVINIR